MEYAVWAWNGWNSQYVEEKLGRKQVVRAMLEARHNRQYGLDSIVVLEDDEHLTAVVTASQEFYGERRAVTVYTTRAGAWDMDDDGLGGVWTS